MSLSSTIVEREIASIREVEEALARQVLYGGDFVTNILEVCKADEAALVTAAADAFGLPAGPPGELPIAPADAHRLVTADIAQERAIAPIGIDAYGLVLAVAEPLSREVLDELAFALAVPISQRLVPLVRIRQALARDYGLPMDRRLTRLLARLTGGVAPPRSMPPRPPEQAPPPRPPSAPPVLSLPPPGPAGAGAGALLRVSNIPPPPASRRRRGPLTLDVAERELEEATARDAIFDVVFEFAKQFFDYTAIFVVHGEIAEGRDAFGNGTAREKVARIGVPLDMPGVLATAFSTVRTHRGVPDPVGLDRVLFGDLGRPGDNECVVIPVVVRKRVVALVLGDSGSAGIDADGAAQIERVMLRASAAFERLILRKKLQGSKQPGEQAPAPANEPVGEVTSGGDLPPAIRAMLQAPAVPDLARAPVVTEAPQRRAALSDVPPPEAVFAVRRPSGPPIPREEPVSSPHVPVAAAAPEPVMAKRRKSSSTHRAVAPTFDFSGTAGSDNAPTPIAPPVYDPSEAPTPAAPPVAEADALPAMPPLPPPVADVPPPRKSTRQMPASEQQISVAAHKPPSSRDVGSILPSIIVDVSTEYGALVQRILASATDDEAESELLRGGEAAIPALMAQFPGPITVDRARLEQLPLPRVAECGPILRVLAQQRRAALTPVLARLDDPSVEMRFWATFLLSELTYPDAIEPLVKRIFDGEPRVRRAAKAAARAYAEAFPGPMVTRLSGIATDTSVDTDRRVVAIEALGETREPLAVPKLMELVEADVRPVASASRVALALITRRDFGGDRAAWRAFWSENGERHRVEWLIDALVDESQPMRAAAGEELRALTKEYFGYYEDLPKRERERVKARYEKWWTEVGRVKLARSSRG